VRVPAPVVFVQGSEQNFLRRIVVAQALDAPMARDLSLWGGAAGNL